MADKEDKKYLTPEGRLINHALFEKDVYENPQGGGKGKPRYKVEMAFDPDQLNDLEDRIVDMAIEKWGKDAEADYYDKGTIKSPLLFGDELAKKREAKGKEGDAYKGKIVIRASTEFNGQGQNAPGGVYVAGMDAAELPFTDRGKVYPGCMGKAVLTPAVYETPQGRGVTLYLNGFQLTGEGERLTTNTVAGAFQPVNGTASAPAAGRRRRAG